MKDTETSRRCEVLRQQRIALVVVEFRCHCRPFPAAVVLSNSVLVPRLRHHLQTQYATLRFSQAAERRQRSASSVSPRNRHAMQTAADRRQTTRRKSVRRLGVLCRCSAAYRDDAVVELAVKRSLNADWTKRHNTAEAAVPCLGIGHT